MPPLPIVLCEPKATPMLCRLSADPDTVHIDIRYLRSFSSIRLIEYSQRTHLLKSRLDNLVEIVVRDVREQVPDCISRFGVDCNLIDLGVRWGVFL